METLHGKSAERYRNVNAKVLRPVHCSSMGPRFVNIDHDTPLLLPPNLRDWVPRDHLAHFIWDAVETLDLRQVRVHVRGPGSEQYPPSMLLSLLLSS